MAAPAHDARIAILARETQGRWRVKLDPWTGTARRGQGGGFPSGPPRSADAILAAGQAFLQRHASLLGTTDLDLQRVRQRRTREAWHLTWIQVHGGRPVLGAFVDLTVRPDGAVVGFRSRVVPARIAERAKTATSSVAAARQQVARHLGVDVRLERHRAVWRVVALGGAYALRPALELHLAAPQRLGRWAAWVDAVSGKVLEIEDRLRHATVSGQVSADIYPMYATDALAREPQAWLRVDLARSGFATQVFSDSLGEYRASLPQGAAALQATLVGRYVQVDNDTPDPRPLFEAAVVVPAVQDIHFGDAEARRDERTIYHHTNRIHDFVRSRFGFRLLDFPVPAVAAVRNPQNGSPNYANAFWDGQRMAFGSGSGGFGNFGEYADVVYHEYTHAITDYVYRPVGGLGGALGGAIHEALSDYFACTLTGEPRVGEVLAGPGFRNLDNALRWPEDRDPGDEVHANGEILGGALWDTRRTLGAEVADAVIHFAREQYPMDFDAYLEAMLLADDLLFGDGAPGNGSPHREGILQAFALHGMGPLGTRRVVLEHEPLRDTEADGQPRLVQARVGSLFPGVIDQLTLHWSAGSGFTPVIMVPRGNGVFEASIPGQPIGTTVRYYLRAVKTRPFEERWLPPGAPAETYTYHVGPDTLAPVITHTAAVRWAAFSWPGVLRVGLDDNLGISHAWVEYTLRGVPGARLGLAPVPNEPGVYTTTFPNVHVDVGDRVTYTITAVDASRAANVTRWPAQGVAGIDIVADLNEGFESGPGSWIHRPAVLGRPDPWQIAGLRNHTPGGQRSWQCGSDAGEYPIEVAAALETDWYLLGDAATASVWSWMDAESNGPVGAFDGGVIELQVLGDLVWQPLVPRDGYTHVMSETAGTNVLEPGRACLSGRDTAWRELVFDLAAWRGSRVRLRFLFGSDNVPSPLSLSGWTLDDFHLDPGTLDPTAAPPPELPEVVQVNPPFPNPFNPSVQFQLEVPERVGRIRLDIFDVRGRRLRRLWDGTLEPGRVGLRWDGRDDRGRPLGSGVYVYRVTWPAGRASGRIVLMR